MNHLPAIGQTNGEPPSPVHASVSNRMSNKYGGFITLLTLSSFSTSAHKTECVEIEIGTETRWLKPRLASWLVNNWNIDLSLYRRASARCEARCTPPSNPTAHVAYVRALKLFLLVNWNAIKRFSISLGKHPVEIVGIWPSGTLGLRRRIAMLLVKVVDENWGWMKILVTVNSWYWNGSFVLATSQSPRRTFNCTPLVLIESWQVQLETWFQKLWKIWNLQEINYAVSNCQDVHVID